MICETHHGGEYDATNVIEKPVATAITSIGLDHVAQLGPTIRDIAWHKAGIMKPTAPAFSAPQEPEVAEVLKSRAAEKGVDLRFVDADSSLPPNLGALDAPVQRINSSVAAALAGAFLNAKATPEQQSLTPEDISEGIRKFSWPGRFQIISEGANKWFLDGAHNDISVQQAAGWFARSSAKVDDSHHLHILIYTHFSEERDGTALLESLAAALSENNIKPKYVVFTTYQERKDGSSRIDKTLKTPETPYPDLPAVYSEIWEKIDPDAVVVRQNSIEEALDFARDIGDKHNGMETLITGSLHLVGGALSLLKPIAP
ncbi:hypothetical protein ABW19_dt0202585 [Dactylella cylindrospora]|nr:hypothetical protein ABW19_dt0202585 [Dactylella cylindrospora]